MMRFMQCLLTVIPLLLGLGFAGAGNELVPHASSSSSNVALAENLDDDQLLGDAGWQLIPQELMDTWHQQQQAMANVQSILQDWGLTTHDVDRDGQCQFTALCISGSLDMEPGELRKRVHHFMPVHFELFEEYAEGNWQEYLNTLLVSRTWGDHLTLAAAAIFLERPITVHTTADDGVGDPIVIPTLPAFMNALPINLVHEAEFHYQAVVEQQIPEASQVDPDYCSCGFLLLQGNCINPESTLAGKPKPNRRITHKTSIAASPKPSGEEPLKPPAKPRPLQGSGARKCSICGSYDGHRADTCPLNKQPPNRNGDRGSSTPDAFSPAYSYGPDGQVLKKNTATASGRCRINSRTLTCWPNQRSAA